jgi:hypothetical protein
VRLVLNRHDRIIIIIIILIFTIIIVVVVVATMTFLTRRLQFPW